MANPKYVPGAEDGRAPLLPGDGDGVTLSKDGHDSSDIARLLGEDLATSPSAPHLLVAGASHERRVVWKRDKSSFMEVHPNWRSPVGFLSTVHPGEELFGVAHDLQVDPHPAHAGNCCLIAPCPAAAAPAGFVEGGRERCEVRGEK